MMKGIDINTFVYKNNFLKGKIPINIIITGKINKIYIVDIYDQLDLSKVECYEIYYYKQQGEYIKNHILPKSLKELYCGSNKLTSLPELPNSLQELYCGSNKLKSLPELPNSLRKLVCYNNQLTSLPDLPNSLQYLYCSNNQLISLTILPNSLKRLSLGDPVLNKIKFNLDYKNIKCEFYKTTIKIGDYIIKSKEDYISYMEDYEKHLFNKVKSARN